MAPYDRDEYDYERIEKLANLFDPVDRGDGDSDDEESDDEDDGEEEE